MQGLRKRDIVEGLRPFVLYDSHIHGVAHWARVCRFGEELADRMELPLLYRDCVSVFAWTHDLARYDDDGGREHAIAGATYLSKVLPNVFPALTNQQAEIVRTAIYFHSHGYTAEEAKSSGWFDGVAGGAHHILDTMACCWDADRLDLIRLCMEPDPYRMSTPYWEELLPLSRRLNHQDR